MAGEGRVSGRRLTVALAVAMTVAACSGRSPTRASRATSVTRGNQVERARLKKNLLTLTQVPSSRRLRYRCLLRQEKEVQIVYFSSSGTASPATVDLIRQTAAAVDAKVRASARRNGGGERTVRWSLDPDCKTSVEVLPLAWLGDPLPAGLGLGDAILKELDGQPWTWLDRSTKYLA